MPLSGLAGAHRYVLLVFTGGQPAGAAPAITDLRRRIELQLGAEFLPDRFEFFPLHPRRREGQLDDAWCRAQYLSGALHRKTSDPLFQALTALRTHVVQGAPARGPGTPEAPRR